LAAIGFYGYSFWAPLVIKSLTQSSDLGVGIILGAISAVTIILMLVNSAHSDNSDERPLHVTVPLLIMAVGFFASAFLREPILAVFHWRSFRSDTARLTVHSGPCQCGSLQEHLLPRASHLW
jgi:hypothetical protein